MLALRFFGLVLPYALVALIARYGWRHINPHSIGLGLQCVLTLADCGMLLVVDDWTVSSIQFWVQDNGPGLTAEQQSQLFTQFTRLHQVRVEGHGLGLSIVQRIVTKLGGEVGVESVVGQGSRFWFTLPCA